METHWGHALAMLDCQHACVSPHLLLSYYYYYYYDEYRYRTAPLFVSTSRNSLFSQSQIPTA